MKKAVGFIFCRGGSKELPGKNLRCIAGKPLIGYAIEAALKSTTLDRVIVSTDDSKIAAVAVEFGAEVPFLRPSELAGDDSPELAAWRHALEYLKTDKNSGEVDVFVSIPATSPLRLSIDIDHCVELLIRSKSDIVVTVAKASRSPYFNMLEKNINGQWKLCKNSARTLSNRQQAPEVFEITTVAYAARPAYVMSTESLLDGNVEGYIIPQERAIDIDTEYDLFIAECLMQRRLRGDF